MLRGRGRGRGRPRGATKIAKNYENRDQPAEASEVNSTKFRTPATQNRRRVNSGGPSTQNHRKFTKIGEKNVPKNWGYELEGRGGPGCCFGIVTRLNMYGFRILAVHSNRKGRFGSSPPSNRGFLSWSGCSGRNGEFQNLGISQNRSSTC